MSDLTLYLYTTLAADSSYVEEAFSRLKTILEANKLPYMVIDMATDGAAKALCDHNLTSMKLPALVQCGTIIGGLEEVEEWNESGELRRRVNIMEAPNVATTNSNNSKTIESVGMRPSLANSIEAAAQSSENFHADNVQALGLAAHHRASSVSATLQEEKDHVVRALRRSISAASAGTADEVGGVTRDSEGACAAAMPDS